MIDFELTEEQKMMRESVGAFARDQIRPAARDADETGAIPEALIARSWELGLVQGAIPESFGGFGDQRSALNGAVVAEELAYGDMSIALHMLAPRLLAYPVLEMGTDEQRRRILERFAGRGFAAGTAALVEPRFDFDASDMETTAAPDGDGYVLNGKKCLVPLAAESESCLVFAAPDGKRRGRRVDAFVVDRSAPGVTITEREKNMGLKPLATYGIELKDVRVSADARVGGKRGIDFNRLMSEFRVAIAALGVGLSRAAYDYARDYAKERRAFGVPIATKQSVAFMLADMAIEIDASRLLVWEAAWRLDHGDDALKHGYLAKNYVAASALKIADNAVQVLGGHGYIREHPVEMWLRNARGLAALEGIATV
jgi:alkylation response protein AidB-like acyl-CoA dehydrogenase